MASDERENLRNASVAVAVVTGRTVTATSPATTSTTTAVTTVATLCVGISNCLSGTSNMRRIYLEGDGRLAVRHRDAPVGSLPKQKSSATAILVGDHLSQPASTQPHPWPSHGICPLHHRLLLINGSVSCIPGAPSRPPRGAAAAAPARSGGSGPALRLPVRWIGLSIALVGGSGARSGSSSGSLPGVIVSTCA